MGSFLTVFLVVVNSNALYPGEQHGAVNRIVHYAKQAHGLVLSHQVRIGMSAEEVRPILGVTFNGSHGFLGMAF